MLNIYSKVPIEKKERTVYFNFLSLKVYLQVNFWGAPTHADITKFSNILLELKSQRSGNKTVCDFSIIFILKGIMTF